MAGRRSASSALWQLPRGSDLPFDRSTRLERETPSVLATVFIGNRPSATRLAAICLFELALERTSRTISISIVLRPSMRSSSRMRSSSFFTSELTATGSSESTAAAPPHSRACATVKQIGRNAMAASGRRYRLAWLETLLHDRQLGCPPPPAGITRQQFNASEVVGHKPILKPVLEPFCLCRLFGRNGRQFNLPVKGP